MGQMGATHVGPSSPCRRHLYGTKYGLQFLAVLYRRPPISGFARNYLRRGNLLRCVDRSRSADGPSLLLQLAEFDRPLAASVNESFYNSVCEKKARKRGQG